ncbi:MAG: NYN domain-containing protein [Christensenellales bacterium]
MNEKERPSIIDRRIALLIDAENVSPKYIRYILDELASHGTPTYKRIYGDWTKPQSVAWKEQLLEYSISPIQQYSYTTGKNASDSAMIIDAMDILYSHNVDGFCIVSSDSDFTRLSSRLREAGMFVLGMGEKKTPRAFIVSCEQFKYLESLSVSAAMPLAPEAAASAKTSAPNKDDTAELILSITSIINEISNEDGWAFMGDVGNMLNKRHPDFDTRNYGFQKLTPLVASLKVFDIVSRRTRSPHISLTFVRNKAQKQDAPSSLIPQEKGKENGNGK